MSHDGECVYQAESPDEGAFVAAARNMGFFFSKREIKDVLVKVAQQGAAVGDGTRRRKSAPISLLDIYMFMCVYIYINMYIFINMYIYVCVYISMYTCIQINVNKRTS